MMETSEQTFITEFIKDGEKYEVPQLKAVSWQEAEAKAREVITVVGELG